MPATETLTPHQRDALRLMTHALSLANLTSLEQALPNSNEIDTTLCAFEKLIGQHPAVHDERDPASPYLTPEQQATLGIMLMAVEAWQRTGLMAMAIEGDPQIEGATEVTTDTLASAAYQHALPL